MQQGKQEVMVTVLKQNLKLKHSPEMAVLILLTTLRIKKALHQLSHLEQHNEQLRAKETRHLLGKVDVTTLLKSND